MSNFSEIMASEWSNSTSEMGDEATLNGTPVTIIVQELNVTNRVDPRGGRVREALGVFAISRAQWEQASGAKGNTVVFAGTTYRIENEPDASLATVFLTVKGQAQR